MPIDPDALTALRAMLKPPAAMILQVDWSDAVTHYYADRAYNETPPFHRIGWAVEPRLMGQNSNFENCTFDLNPDLRTEQIPFTFDDLDKTITGLFQTHGSGVRCEIWFYFPNNDDPDLDILTSVWFGTLKAPNVFGWSRLQTVATNGYRSREFTIPSSLWPQECRTKMFGGRAASTDVVRTLICPWDLHLGGTEGIGDFDDCPRLTTADCNTRFGHTRFFGGIRTDASATVTNTQGYVAVSKGNQSALKVPIRVVAGEKYLRGNQLMLWRREFGAQDPEHNWIGSIWAVGEGPVSQIWDIKINEKLLPFGQWEPRTGERGQPRVTQYTSDTSNFSGLAHYWGHFGWVNPLDYSPANLASECRVRGYREVSVFNSDGQPGNGLVGSYYIGYNFDTLYGQRIDYNINFPQTTAPPFEGLPNHNWSVEWNGFITFDFTETYTLSSTHDDGVYVEINGGVIYNFLEGPNGTHSGTFAATADVAYPIKIRFKQGTFHWFLDFKWESASQEEALVPNSALTHAGATGSVRQWTNDRIWWLLECYTSNRFGMAYPYSRFWTDDFKTVSDWGLQTVQYVHTYPDGETEIFSGRRTTFNASLEGRAAVEQIEDICRSGAISFPFQYEGKYTLSAFRIATTDELNDARVFTDTGESRNIVWGEGSPSIILQKIPDEVLINEIILTFEEAENFDLERPITVDDPDQKLRAGRQLGEDNFQTVPKRIAGFGIKYKQEAVRLARRLLKFGEFDEGGTENNLRAIFTVPLEQALGLRRYDIINIVSNLLAGHESPQAEAFEYFRVLRMRKAANGQCEITAIAYNQTAYEDFETVTVSNPAPPRPSDPVEFAPSGNPVTPTLSVSYDADNGFIEVTAT